MSEHNRQSDYIRHILEAVAHALDYIEGFDKTDFLSDNRTQQACIMNILIIGEAATKLINQYPEFIEQHSTIPWFSMRGMRNRIAHGYFDIDLDVVWETITEALPQLQQQLKEVLNQTEIKSADI